MRAVLILIASALLAALAPAASAGGDAAKAPGPRGHDCSKAPDPKACEERREKMRQAMNEVRKACEGKEGAAHMECKREQMCARTKDPAMCGGQAKERTERRGRDKPAKPAS